jgi:hypothetical protein
MRPAQQEYRLRAFSVARNTGIQLHPDSLVEALIQIKTVIL